MKTDINIRACTEVDIARLAMSLRDDDRRETEAYGFETPYDALGLSLDRSAWALTAETIHGEIVACWGLIHESAMGNVGNPWLLTGPGVETRRRMFLTYSKREVGRMLHECPVLTAMIDARYERACRWAKHIGFTLGDPTPWGLKHMPHVLAHMEA